MKRKESYIFVIRAIIKFNNAVKENIKPNKLNIISFFKTLVVLFFLFLVYCKYNIIKRLKDKNIYPKIKLQGMLYNIN